MSFLYSNTLWKENILPEALQPAGAGLRYRSCQRSMKMYRDEEGRKYFDIDKKYLKNQSDTYFCYECFICYQEIIFSGKRFFYHEDTGAIYCGRSFLK